MDGKKIAIWVLSILFVLSAVALVIVGMRYRKAVAKIANPLDVLKNYVATLPIYSSNADAVANGLKVGDRYRLTATADTFMTVTA